MLDSLSSQTPLPKPAPAVIEGEELGPLVGRRIRGYELVGLIGEGPAGAVYRARNETGKLAAIKVFHRDLSRPPIIVALTDLFTRLSDLDAVDIIGVSDSGITQDGLFFYISPLVEGVDLQTYLTKLSLPLDSKRALSLGQKICHALADAHKEGIIHGGVKPRNIFVSADGRTVWLLDFGVSRLAGSLDQGVILGDPSFMAPEQFGGRTEAASDVYAVGVLLYWLVSGELPFVGPGHGRIMMKQLSEKPVLPAGIESWLGDVILKALSKEPEARFQTIELLGEALQAQGRAPRVTARLETLKPTPTVSQPVNAKNEEESEPSMATKSESLSNGTPDELYPVGEERATEISLPSAGLDEADFEAAPVAAGLTIPITKLEVVDVESPPRETVTSRGRSQGRPTMPPKPPRGKEAAKPAKAAQAAKKNELTEDTAQTALPSASPSMEASLEDFISQANASFPSTDGWDLHTGDVELLDEDDELGEVVVKPVAAPAPVAAKAAAPNASFKTPYASKPTPARGTKPMPTIEVKPGISVLPMDKPEPAKAAAPSAPAQRQSRPTRPEIAVPAVTKAPTPSPTPTAKLVSKPARKSPFDTSDDAADSAPTTQVVSPKRRNPFDGPVDNDPSVETKAPEADGFPPLPERRQERRKKSAVPGPTNERRRDWAKNVFAAKGELESDDDVEELSAPADKISAPWMKSEPTDVIAAAPRAMAITPTATNQWKMIGAVAGAFAVGALIVSVVFSGKPKAKTEAPAPVAVAAPVAAAPAAAAPVAAAPIAAAPAAPAPAAAAPAEALKPVIPAPQPIVTALPAEPVTAAPVVAPKHKAVRHVAHAAAPPRAVAKREKPAPAPKPVAVAKSSKKAAKSQKSGDWVDPFSE